MATKSKKGEPAAGGGEVIPLIVQAEAPALKGGKSANGLEQMLSLLKAVKVAAGDLNAVLAGTARGNALSKFSAAQFTARIKLGGTGGPQSAKAVADLFGIRHEDIVLFGSQRMAELQAELKKLENAKRQIPKTTASGKPSKPYQDIEKKITETRGSFPFTNAAAATFLSAEKAGKFLEENIAKLSAVPNILSKVFAGQRTVPAQPTAEQLQAISLQLPKNLAFQVHGNQIHAELVVPPLISLIVPGSAISATVQGPVTNTQAPNTQIPNVPSTQAANVQGGTRRGAAAAAGVGGAAGGQFPGEGGVVVAANELKRTLKEQGTIVKKALSPFSTLTEKFGANNLLLQGGTQKDVNRAQELRAAMLKKVQEQLNLHQRLIDSTKKRVVTEQDLANQAKLTQSTIGKLESLKRSVTKDPLLKHDEPLRANLDKTIEKLSTSQLTSTRLAVQARDAAAAQSLRDALKKELATELATQKGLLEPLKKRAATEHDLAQQAAVTRDTAARLKALQTRVPVTETGFQATVEKHIADLETKASGLDRRAAETRQRAAQAASEQAVRAEKQYAVALEKASAARLKANEAAIRSTEQTSARQGSNARAIRQAEAEAARATKLERRADDLGGALPPTRASAIRQAVSAGTPSADIAATAAATQLRLRINQELATELAEHKKLQGSLQKRSATEADLTKQAEATKNTVAKLMGLQATIPAGETGLHEQVQKQINDLQLAAARKTSAATDKGMAEQAALQKKYNEALKRAATLREQANDLARRVEEQPNQRNRRAAARRAGQATEAEAEVTRLGSGVTSAAGGAPPPVFVPPVAIRPGGFFKDLGNEFLANTVNVAKWAASVGVLYGALNLARSALSSMVQTSYQTARLAQVFSYIGGTAKELAGDVLRLAAAEGRSAEEAVASAVDWARLGLTRREVNEAVRLSLMAANIAEIDVREATEGLQQIMQSYGLTVSDLAAKLGGFNAVSNTSFVKVGALIGGFSRVAGIANQAGISFERLTGILSAAASASGQTPTNFANALKTIISRLANPELQKKLEEQFKIVVQADVNTGEIKNADEVLGLLAQKYQELGNAQAQNLVRTVAGATQINRLAVILDTYAASLTASIIAQRGLNSAEQEDARLKDEALNRLGALKSAWQAFWNAVNQSHVTGALATSLDFFAKLLTPPPDKNLVRDMAEEKKFTDELHNSAAAAGTATDSIRLLQIARASLFKQTPKQQGRLLENIGKAFPQSPELKSELQGAVTAKDSTGLDRIVDARIEVLRNERSAALQNYAEMLEDRRAFLQKELAEVKPVPLTEYERNTTRDTLGLEMQRRTEAADRRREFRRQLADLDKEGKRNADEKEALDQQPPGPRQKKDIELQKIALDAIADQYRQLERLGGDRLDIELKMLEAQKQYLQNLDDQIVRGGVTNEQDAARVAIDQKRLSIQAEIAARQDAGYQALRRQADQMKTLEESSRKLMSAGPADLLKKLAAERLAGKNPLTAGQLFTMDPKMREDLLAALSRQRSEQRTMERFAPPSTKVEPALAQAMNIQQPTPNAQPPSPNFPLVEMGKVAVQLGLFRQSLGGAGMALQAFQEDLAITGGVSLRALREDLAAVGGILRGLLPGGAPKLSQAGR